MKILVIEDDLGHSLFIKKGFTELGHVVDTAKDGSEGLYMANEQKYDVIILDRLLPKMDGLVVMSALRNSNNKTPVLFLSSLSQVEERVKGLRAGGDDYLTKPFAFSELVARVDALYRRHQAASETRQVQSVFKVADLELNLMTREVHRGGIKIDLQQKEFQILEFLMRYAGQIVTRTMLIESVWDFHFTPQTNIIDAQVSKLRQKIDKDFKKPLIFTIRGAGYKISDS